MAKPVGRAAITSEWSPKMESAGGDGAGGYVEHRRSQLPGDLVHVGEHQEQTLRCGEGGGQRPGLQLEWTAPAAPASLCISTTSGTTPQRFGLPACDQASANSPMGDAGGDRVDGDHLAQGVGNRAAASFPSTMMRSAVAITGMVSVATLVMRAGRPLGSAESPIGKAR